MWPLARSAAGDKVMVMDPARSESDATPDAERAMIERWRHATVEEKLAEMVSLGLKQKELAMAELRRRYPSASERENQLRFASRTIDRETMIRAFGWDPELHGK
jgi:hypothetical protein